MQDQVITSKALMLMSRPLKLQMTIQRVELAFECKNDRLCFGLAGLCCVFVSLSHLCCPPHSQLYQVPPHGADGPHRYTLDFSSSPALLSPAFIFLL